MSSFLKILVIGETATGKSSIVNRIVQNSFQESYKATIGCEFGFKVIEVGGVTVRVQLWDLAGQDRLGGISRLYCRDANGALVIADITREDTIAQAAKWKTEVDENVKMPDNSPIPMALCLNKCDLITGLAAKQDKYEAEAKDQHFLKCWFTSAKMGTNVDEALVYLVGQILNLAGVKEEYVADSKGKKLEETLVSTAGTKKCSC
jgi:Ras-related protein Rab-32